MTEAEWLTCAEPTPMIQLLASKRNKRKLAMFGVGRCRHLSRLCSDERGLIAIDVAERYADRKAKINEVRVACRTAREDATGNARPLGQYANEIAVLYNAAFNALLVSDYALRAASDQAGEKALQCALLRDIFGNPFRPVAFDPRWRTADVTALARGIYEDRAFDRLPLLADALMDAGCDSDDVLSHCRSDGPHVRGCWVVDLVLGKE